MARAAFDQKPYRKDLAEAWGAQIFASPSTNTSVGKNVLQDDPDGPGSMSIAKSEAIEDVMRDEKARNAVGSIMNFVLASQTLIGLEAQKQFEPYGDYPDIVVGCVGGGSNFSGIFWPYYYDKISKRAPKDVRFLGVESTAAPRFTKGEYLYDHSDVMRTSPLFRMYTIGHNFVPPPIHTGGLRVHGAAPSMSLLYHEKQIDVVAYNQTEIFDAAAFFASTEGIVAAPETAHAIKGVIDEAKKCKQTGEKKVILFNLCGHGLLDLEAYREYKEGHMEKNDADVKAIKKALNGLKELYPWVNK